MVDVAGVMPVSYQALLCAFALAFQADLVPESSVAIQANRQSEGATIDVSDDDKKALPPGELVVLTGSARIFEQGGKGGQLRPSHGSRTFAQPVYIELGVASSLELRFEGLSSLRLEGPAAFEWRPASKAIEANMEWVVHRARKMDAELRRGQVRMSFEEQAWRLDLGKGAYHFDCLPSKEIQVVHHGGQAIRVRTTVVRKPGTWPARILPTSGLRLPGPP